jgi:uncharacterized protein (TIGR03000 family)
MSRLSLAVLLVPCVAVPALAQGLRDTTPTPLYRSANPFVPPLMSWGPQAAWPGAVAPIQPWARPALVAWPGWGWGGGYNPYTMGGIYNPYYASPYTWGWGMSEPSADYWARSTQPPPLQGAGGSGAGAGTGVETQLVVNPELPAELTLEFPADAAVTLNGRAAEGSSGRTQTLTSPPLRAGESYTFDVKANWTADGKKYEWERTVTLGSGERSKVAVARGFPVNN